MSKSLSSLFAVPLLLAAALVTAPAGAVLKPGEKAPDFSAPSSLGGQVSTFSLTSALKKGPVVLYFYPAAFSSGCTVEAHLFAEATDRYKALGATVIGISADNIETLNKFSVSACRSKFAVVADVDQKVMKAYDSVLNKNPERASRTSYVIAPDHSVIYEYTDMNPEKHVENTMHALEQWSAKKKQ
ncbi:peroxiredoxin [Herbaspirillum sp. YR522]|uniref:peroxiredoxin n=1 Tax=Herbaspirillum sp. YR522 TaxID=1144342 RepID=UPI00026F6E60|nr:peroxiredoxin [Herbaspirillum sp. YR522]EJM96975.1 Peroxiredoxin [Herbaspirillum sp. YR522]